jgi:putative Ca2+/H+ antiporter (TMEM165/GDT1 family)
MSADPEYTLIVEKPVIAKLWLVPAFLVTLSALIGSYGLVSAAREASQRADTAEAAVAAAREQLEDQTIEQRCRANASADVQQAQGALLAGFSQAFEGEFGDRAAIRARLNELRVDLDDALSAQQAALSNCKT